MSSDKSQTQVGGTIAAIGQMGAREGGLSAAMKRVAVAEAAVNIRLKDDKGEALDAALTDSAFMAKTDGDLKNLSGTDLLTEMMNNPLTQAKSGTSWAQISIAKAGLDQELAKLIEGAPVVEERQSQTNIKHLLAAKSLTEMTPLQVQFLQQNLERLGLFKGKIDGDFANTALVAGLDALATTEKVIEKSMKGGMASLDFVWALRNRTAQSSEKPSGEKQIMNMFKADAKDVAAPLPAGNALPITSPRQQLVPV